MNLFIIVPVHNRKNTVLNFLKQLSFQTYQNFNTVIVDDGSKDGTFDSIKQLHPSVELIYGNGEWWWSKSVNMGVKYAISLKATHILLMNDDIYFSKNFLFQMLSDYTPGSIMGCLSLIKGEPDKIFFSGVNKINKITANTRQYHKKYTPVYTTLKGLHKSIALPGRGLLIPTNVFSKIGYFDEKRLPQYKADSDFVIRAYKAGIPTYINYNAIIYNEVEKTGKGASFLKTSFKDFLKSYFSKYSHNSLRSNFYFKLKHGVKILIPFLMLEFILKSIVFHLYNNYLKKYSK